MVIKSISPLFGPLLHVETLSQRAFYRNGDTYRQQDLVTANFGERVDRPFHFTHHVGDQRGFLLPSPLLNSTIKRMKSSS